MSGSTGRRPFALALAGTAAVAVAYRILVLGQLRGAPVFLEPVLDGAAHLAWAEGLLAGIWPGGEPFFRAPGYVGVLAALLGITGDAAAAAAVQLVLGAGVAVLAAALAYRLFGRAAAWVAGLATAVYPTLAFFDFQFLAPFAAVPLALGATLATLAADRCPSRARVVTAALLWSAAAVVRPPLLAGAAVLPAVLLLRPERRGRLAAIAGIVALALPLVATLHNVRAGDPAFLATQGGLNFYLGNGRHADGYAATFPDAPTARGYRMMEAAADIARREEGRTLRPSEVSDYWNRRAWADIVRDPLRWLGLLGKKTVLFASAREIPNNHDPVLVAEHVPALRLPGWGLWLPLAGAGLWLGRRRRDVRVVAGVVVAVALGCVLFFVNARFRVPAAPLLVALGAGGLLEGVARFRSGSGRSLAGAALVALGIAAVAWSNPWGLPREPWLNSYLLVAEAERNRGEPVRALEWLERLLEEEPGHYAARLAHLEMLRVTGRRAEAEAFVDHALAQRPEDPTLLREKAILLDLAGRPADALPWIDRAVAADPGNVGLRIDRAVLLAGAGRAGEARALLTEILRARPGTPEAARAARALGTLE